MSQVLPDLYWHWAVATNYVYTGVVEQSDQLMVQAMVELTNLPCAACELHAELQRDQNGLVPLAYLRSNMKYCTIWVKRKYISRLPARLVVRFKLGVSERYGARLEQQPPVLMAGPGNEEQDSQERDSRQDRTIAPPYMLAVIDDVIQEEHSTFRNQAGHSRVVLLWDQASGKSIGPSPRDFQYRRFLGNTRHWVDSANKRAASHGTHVASLAGGRETPPYRMRHSSPADFATAAERDNASDIPLAMVMLPDLTVADTSGGALGVNVLDALTFLCDNTDAATHLIVNLSFGTMGGPHDGSSLLEAAIADLVDRRQGKLTVVLPAGNSFEAQCHAAFPLGIGASHELTWRILPDDRTCSFMELWLPNGANVAVQVKPPGQQAKTVVRNQAVEWTANQLVYASARYATESANGNGQMVLIAVAPTRTNEAQTAPHGDWTVTVTNRAGALDRVHAWIERDDTSFGRKVTGRQSYLVDPARPRYIEPVVRRVAAHGGVTGLGTLNSMGCSSQVVVVGGFEFRRGEIAKYSAAGDPPHVRCPDGISPSEESPMLRGLPGAANTDAGVVRVRGTSVAAPVVARWFANELLLGRPIPWPVTTVPGDPQRGSDTYAWGRQYPITTAPATPSTTQSASPAPRRSRRSPGRPSGA